MLIRNPQDIKSLGTILSVWAHPDDESFCCAGIMAAAIKNGQTVVCITATKGEAGVQNESRWPTDKLGEIRAGELKKACQILGVTDHHWLGYKDGTCHQVPEAEAADKIKKLIERYKPDTVLTFGPEGMTGHLDHQAVSRWVSLASKGTKARVYHYVEDADTYENHLKDMGQKFNVYFNIDKPPTKPACDCDIAFELTPELTKKKYLALEAMPSQTEAMFSSLPPDYLKSVFKLECYVRAP